MAKMILSMDGLVLKEIPLDKERITIGRKAHNDIQIDNLAISGEHAAIVTILNDSFLEDLNSTNGTLVNGQPVKKHFLKNNDVVELGKYKLKYINEAPVAANADFEKTMIMRPGGLKAPPPAEEAQARAAAQTVVGIEPEKTSAPVGQATASIAAAAVAPAAGQAPAAPVQQQLPAVIQLLNGPNIGKELELTKTLTTLGKPGVQVAVIAKRPHGYFLTHVEGAHYPIVNGNSLDPQAYQLEDHDVIEIAGIKMEFYFKT
ncbi:MAG: Glycogen accumulation regulator GarA [Betaproteobacteria bacterium ADurb.Bin341]|nr:MAG: Glycogen accumulation regulator GarA [Betaproteobacteria bacterium ADurb.Bin341]